MPRSKRREGAAAEEAGVGDDDERNVAAVDVGVGSAHS
jgi:hypothetical protein